MCQFKFCRNIQAKTNDDDSYNEEDVKDDGFDDDYEDEKF